jgi:hypothetical protein
MNSEQKDLFHGMELGHVDDPMEELADYNTVYLSELPDETIYIGNPLMLKPFEFDYVDDKTGREMKKNKFRLCLVRSDEEEYLEIGINLKRKGDIQQNIRKGSVLFDLLYGLMEHRDPGSMDGSNVFKSVDLSFIRDFVNGLEFMKVTVVAKTGRFDFNTIEVEGIQ